jgi:hypothetical protein
VAGLEAERRAGEPDLRSYALKIGPQILRDLLRKETALLIKSRV